MSEEEVKLLKEMQQNCIDQANYIDPKAMNNYNMLRHMEDMILNLQQRIDKAIEYINSNPNVFYDENLIDVETLLKNEYTDEYVGDIKFISKLLSILKGEDK